MRPLSTRRRWRPAALAGGLVALSVAAAGGVAVLNGGPQRAAGLLAGGGGPPAAPAPPAAAGRGAGGTAGDETGGAAAGDAARATLTGAAAPRLIVPDVIASVPGGLTAAGLARIRRLSGVRAVLPVDGARITVNGRRLTVLAAPAAALRPWTPPATAASRPVWAAFARGELIAAPAAARAARLAGGGRYQVAARERTRLAVGAVAGLGITGVDGIVGVVPGRRLGLARGAAVLVNAPAVSPLALVSRVRAALGPGSRVVRLVPARVSTSLPVDTAPPTGRPASYLQLFRESAARYCPGLSWTVLAAIGQIESADGRNVGPSSAGALGPMQFLPSTWRAWGIAGFGDTGPPDIMNPFDAVPSAARLLCAAGAASGGSRLRAAIFAYNHASWYVDEVLTLAAEYAREFG